MNDRPPVVSWIDLALAAMVLALALIVMVRS